MAIYTDFLKPSVTVSPQYTSQTCSRCLHLGVRPSQSNFQCRDCGYQINADLNGAKSIAKRHDLVAVGRYFCEYPWKEVKGARSGSFFWEEASSTKPETASSIYSASSRLDGLVDHVLLPSFGLRPHSTPIRRQNPGIDCCFLSGPPSAGLARSR